MKEKLIFNVFHGCEYPSNFHFYSWAKDVEPEQFREGLIVGEADTIGPDQWLIWEQGSVVGRSKKRCHELGLD